MRNIIQFIYRFHVGLIFIALMIFCFYLVFQHNNFQKAIFINASSKISGLIMSKRDELSDYLKLKEINDALADENARLRNEDPHSFIRLNEDLALIDDSLMRRKYMFISSRIVNKSINRQSNYLTINKGEKNGLQPEMGVVNLNQVVGKVRHVSDHFAVVMPVINSKFQLSVRTERDNEFGLLNWDGRSPYYASVVDLPKHTVIKAGDKIVTTGFSAHFPENMLVGTVLEITSDDRSEFVTVKIELATKFDQLNYVEVVSNLMRKEQAELESLIQMDESE